MSFPKLVFMLISTLLVYVTTFLWNIKELLLNKNLIENESETSELQLLKMNMAVIFFFFNGEKQKLDWVFKKFRIKCLVNANLELM